MKFNTMINKLIPIGTWERAFLLIFVLIFSLSALQAQDLSLQDTILVKSNQPAKDSILVKGLIVSGTNAPLSNITVSIEGSAQLPVITNESGEFSIKAKAGDNWLIITPASDYKTKRVFVNNRSELTVFLTPNDLTAGDDQLTILSQKRNNKDMVASYFNLKTSDTYKTSAYSVDEYMQGKVPGMNVIRREGAPCTGAVTFIRGINSINASNQPLYIIDGIPMEKAGLFGSNLEGFAYDPLLGVNLLDISNVVVVKDPAITAAYGSKGSNGVVLIQTLDPSATQTSIDVDFRMGFTQSPSNLLPQLNGDQHKTLANEVLFTSGMPEEVIKVKYPSLFLKKTDQRYIDYQHNTDWQDQIFSDAMFSNINVKVKGGDAIAKYGLSFGYTNSDGTVSNTGYDSYNLRFVGLLNIFKWLRMNTGVSLNYNTAEMKESAMVKETSPILSALAISPLLNPYQYDTDGNMLRKLREADEFGISNPAAIINTYNAKNTNYHFISSMGFEASLNKDMILNTNFGLTYNSLKEQIFMPNHGMAHYYNFEAHNVAKLTNNYLLSLYNNTYLSYKKVFNKVHNITSSTGLNVLTNKYQLDWGSTMNAHENDQYQALQDGTNNLRRIGGENIDWNWLSLYENLNYSFKDRYLVTSSISLDGSSQVGDHAINTVNIAGNPYGIFYSAGIGWRLSNEAFLQNVSWIDELKLRASYGKTGNNDIGASNASNYYRSIRFRETVGLYPATLSNDALSYETVTQLNFGIDLALWGSRLRTTLEVFNSTINDMMMYMPVKSYFGYSYRPENGEQMKNNGLEISAFVRIIDGKSFKWDIQGNFTKIRNEITELKTEQLVIPIKGGEVVNMIGETANSFFGYLFDGVYSSASEAQAANLMNDKFVKYQAGDARFVDISGPDGQPDGIINQYDKTIIGSSMPNLYGGIQNTFSYKKWSLNTYINFVSGNELYNYVRYRNEQMTGLQNQSTSVLSRWQYDGQQTSVPRALWNDPVGNAAFSSRWIEDGSYVRIQNISLSYHIPNKFFGFRNAEFYVSVNNAFTFSHYLGYDPEFATSYTLAEQGVDYGQNPQSRQFIFGIKLGL